MNNIKKYLTRLVTISLISVFVFTGCQFDNESKQDRKVILQTIESHGGEYRIVRERFGSIGDSGRNDDFIKVDQNGLIYTVYAAEGKVKEDFYVKAREGKERSEEIATQLPTVFSGKKYRFLSDIRENEVLNSEYFNMKIVFFEEDVSDIAWLYNLYSYLCDNEAPFSLHVILYEEAEESVVSEIENGYNKADCSANNEYIGTMPKLTEEQFVKSFRKMQ